MSWACGKCDREKRKIKGDIIPEHFRTCPKRKSMTTNETLIEKALNINRHWWIARAMTTYGVKKAVAELIYEDIQAILEDKAQDVASALQAKERVMVEKFKEMIGEDEEFTLEESEPRLFQSDPTPNEMGGYSSVPFYCSLCFMSEMDIQDNKLGEGKYHCYCSVWGNPCGGKWLDWYDKKEAKKCMDELPTEQNFRNQLKAELRSKLSNLSEKK